MSKTTKPNKVLTWMLAATIIAGAADLAVTLSKPRGVLDNVEAAEKLMSKGEYAQADAYIEAAIAAQQSETLTRDNQERMLGDKAIILAKAGKDDDVRMLATGARMGGLYTYKVAGAEALVRFRAKECWRGAAEKAYVSYTKNLGDFKSLTGEIEGYRAVSGCIGAESKIG